MSAREDDRAGAAATADAELLAAARARGPFATLLAWLRLSGPGWLQSAVTLGGGSLATSLYLGVLAGYSFLWLQPLAMLLGIAMLSAIAHVTLVTGQRPFAAINAHVSPVLGYGWALASLLASMVWCMPQYALAVGCVQQNLLPTALGAAGPLGDFGGKVAITAAIWVTCVLVTSAYGRGGRGVKLYERALKVLVAAIVLCFVLVAVRTATTDQTFRWAEVVGGFVPDLSRWSEPAPGFAPFLEPLADRARAWWSARIVAEQRDVILGAAATAVGINMTFLMPYSLLAKGWTRPFSGLVRFDLLTGMLLPFALTISCVVLAAASRFHAEPVPGLVDATASPPAARMVQAYDRALAARTAALGGDVTDLPREERLLAAMLVKRDAQDLAQALTPMTGETYAHLLFGLGALGMALSTITLLMLISGFVVCEVLGRPQGGIAHRMGTLLASSGVLGPFLWGDAALYLAVPTSLFGIALLPIAYWAFVFLLNSKSLLGDERPRGWARLLWNAFLLPAALLASVASAWSIWQGARLVGVLAVAAFLIAALALRPRVTPP
ncbi:MAG: divalent metal cation transporter [Planctomycetota bacterium]